ILQNRHGAPEPALELTDFADHPPMRGVVAVAEIQPGDVHAGANQALEVFVGGRGGSDGADNFSAAHFRVIYTSRRENQRRGEAGMRECRSKGGRRETISALL